MTRVLVTGARGFVGQELVSALAGFGYSGVGTGRQQPTTMPEGWRAARRTDVLQGTVDPGAIDAIVHLEVKHHVTNLNSASISEMNSVNLGGTNEWLDWAAERNLKRFVFASSIKAVRAESGPTLETAQAENEDPYGHSKAEAEEAVRAWTAAHSSRAAAILRFAPVYGPGNTANLAAFARQVLRGRPCFVGKGDTRKAIVSLRNVTAAIEWVLRDRLTGCEVFNVADRTTPSMLHLATLIAEAAGAQKPSGIPRAIANLAAVAGDASALILGRSAILNSRRLKAMLETTVFPVDKLVNRGFVHPQTTEQGIAELVGWLKTAGDSATLPGREEGSQ